MEQLTLGQIADFCHGRVSDEHCDIFVNGISRDNRVINHGDLFVAICGANFDGHDFTESAITSGAAAVLVSKEPENSQIPAIVVEDTLSALHEIATAYRDMFCDLKVAGVTGSVGKTTTKEMCAAVLSAKMYTHKTNGNLNNDIGLPFTIMGLNYSHEAAVIEMGANHFGEISLLTKIAKPDVAVITTIGEAHLEFFKSKKGVRKAKLEILEGLKPGGTLVLNGDDPLLWELKETLGVDVVYCGIKNADVDIFGEIINHNARGITFAVRGADGVEFKINCSGEHNLQNALIAAAVGRKFGCSWEEIKEGLESFVNTGARQRIMEFDGITVISDCYNAGPDSMRAALKVLAKSGKTSRKIAVLGDMLELGEHSQRAHTEIGSAAVGNADLIFAAGKWSHCVVEGAVKEGFDPEKAFSFKKVEDLSEKLKEILQEGDVLLVKGSRGMRMEQVIDAIK